MEIRKPISLKKQAYDAIRTAVLQQELKRDLIYSEQWFADQFHVSRTPVREALLQLRNEGLIEVLPNRGVIIKQVTFEDAKNICHMRAAIEGYCSAYLAKHAQEEGGREALKRVETVLERCRENFNYADELQFHLEIIQFTNNPEFIDSYSRMRTKIDVFWNDVAGQANRHAEIYREHKAILDAMKAGDAETARRANEQHIMIILEKVKHGELLNSQLEDLRTVDAIRA